MRKILVLLAMIIGTATVVLGQVNYATVTGTITDPNGNPYANASLVANLVNAQGYPVSSATTPNGQLFNAKQVLATLDATGHFSIPLVPNNTLSSPSGTQWAIAISYPKDTAILTTQLPWNINYTLSVTGSVDLSLQLSALAQAINFVNLSTGQSTIASTGGAVPVGIVGQAQGYLTPKSFGPLPLYWLASLQTFSFGSATPCTGASCITLANGNGTFGGVLSAATAVATNSASIGPRYDVTQFGAVGNGVTDDTAAIQAASEACYNGGVAPTGGIVEFPGPHTYIVSNTITIHEGCLVEGVYGNSVYGSSPVKILSNWSASGSYTVTGYSVQSFSTYSTVTVTATNSLVAGQWVYLQGFSIGTYLNRVAAKVLSTGLSSSQFEVQIPWGQTTVSGVVDSGTATAIVVVLQLSDTTLAGNTHNAISGVTVAGVNNSLPAGIDVFFARRTDAGSRVISAWAQNATLYGYYFSYGGLNTEFDKGWRCDSIGISGGGCIYWRLGGTDNFGIANGTNDNSSAGGAAVIFDNSACGLNRAVHFTSRNFKFEDNTSFVQDSNGNQLGAFTLYDCPARSSGYGSAVVQATLDFENTWVIAQNSTAGVNLATLAVIPANDAAVNLTVINGTMVGPYPPNTSSRWLGLPQLSRFDKTLSAGQIPFLSYAYPGTSMGQTSGSNSPGTTMHQMLGDVNIGQLWQYGTQASDFLYTDTAFAALPNATTLFAGQTIAPPGYWSGVNGKRYALDVVYQTGTTGSPNAGATTCTGTTGTSVLTCTSATGLSPGQRITIGADTNKMIQYVDATVSGAVLVNLSSNIGTTYSTATALVFSAPLLGSEIQLLTKCSAAPTTGTWVQGDYCENSAAAANGIAGWVNVVAGTPGTWAAVPLGNSSGQLALGQVVASSPSTSPVCPNGTGGSLTTSGCSTSGGFPLTVGSPVDLTGLSANVSSATLYAVPSGNAGWYRVHCYTVVTQAATTSSTLPYCTISYTDEDTNSAALQYNGGTVISVTPTAAYNQVGTTSRSGSNSGMLEIRVKDATNITYAATSYASSGATPMQYALHAWVEYVHQ